MIISSILDSIKKSLGLDPDYDPFDPDLIMLINTIFDTYHQMGIGPKDGFTITGSEQTWDDYGETSSMKQSIKTLTYLKVKQLFDPPSSSVLSDAMKEKIDELTYRLFIEHNLEYTWDSITSSTLNTGGDD